MIFHRWTAISIIGALLGRRVYFPLGHRKVYPNQYILLAGSPGARKGSSISFGTKLLEDLDFNYFAPSKAAKEALWEWMSKQSLEKEADEWIDDVIDTEYDPAFFSQAYVASDEFLDFIGFGDDALMTNLTKLWDNPTKHQHERTRSKPIIVQKPTINILSGLTPGGVAEAFRGLAASGGFFSRIIFVFSQPSGKRVTFPSEPDKDLIEELHHRLIKISELEGELQIIRKKGNPVYDFIDSLYKSGFKMPDGRFAGYSERRIIHFYKLLTIICAADLTLVPTVDHCILANTILAVTEQTMPLALGEFGKSKHADIANRVVDMISNSDLPLTSAFLWKAMARDVDKPLVLQEILQNLVSAERIQRVSTKGSSTAYIAHAASIIKWDSKFVDYSLLHPDEHNEDTGEIIPIGAKQ